MLISVTIPAWNAADYLRIAIDSVLAQTYKPLELIVVDDGSTDHTREVCQSYGSAVRYFYHENDGTAGISARKYSIRESRGEWIAFLDHDDRWLPDKLAKQVEAIKTYPDAGVLFTRYKCINAHGDDLNPSNLLPVSGGAFCLEPHEAFHHLLKSNPYCPSSALIRKHALEQVELPDKHVCGDWSQWLSLTRKYPMVVLDEYLTEYRITDVHFCANKEQLATRMLATLKQQEKYLRQDCNDCRTAYSAGQAHVAHIFAVAARTFLDQYHADTQAGRLAEALPSLWSALRAAPMEVLQAHRLMAVFKNGMLGAFKKDKSTDDTATSGSH
jgi:glycosyltransferase involved in cell wall biosynthesis